MNYYTTRFTAKFPKIAVCRNVISAEANAYNPLNNAPIMNIKDLTKANELLSLAST
jgi:hypothetical protein